MIYIIFKWHLTLCFQQNQYTNLVVNECLEKWQSIFVVMMGGGEEKILYNENSFWDKI